MPRINFWTYNFLNISLCAKIGAYEIIGMGMLVAEDRTSKSKNSALMRTRLAMTDKDINERDMIKVVLPHLKVLICLFHTLRAFRREETTENMSKECPKKKKKKNKTQVFITSFQLLYPSKWRHLDKNWSPIKEEWVMGFKFSISNFLKTNNRLESINGKLKQVITKYSFLVYFIEQFFIILPVLRNKRNYKTVYSYQKVKVVSHNNNDINSPEAQYTDLITSYTSNFVLKQLTLSETDVYEFVPIIGNAGIFHGLTSQGRIAVSHFRCSCCFFQSMKLPCRHIFRLHQNAGVSLYDKNICYSRRTNFYYRSTHKTLKNLNKSMKGKWMNLLLMIKISHPLTFLLILARKCWTVIRNFRKP